MPRTKKVTEVAKATKNPKEDTFALMSPQDLHMQIELETQKRKLITDFITQHLVRGTDYGAIHVAKNCPNKFNCTNKYHFSKDVLFKPGAEKFCSLFKLRAEFKKDTETWEMLGSKSGEVAYICQLFSTQSILVGEGRGVASVVEKGNANTAVKIAEKRAKLDAVLSTGALSDFFTQDLEDMMKTAEPEVDDMPKIVYDEPKSNVSNKTKIAHLLQLLDIDIASKDILERIRALTSLDVTNEKNHQDIIDRLGIILNERKNNKAS